MCRAQDAKQDAHGSESGAILQLIERVDRLIAALGNVENAMNEQSEATMQLCRTSADLIQILAAEQGDEAADGEQTDYLSGKPKR